MTTPGSNLLAQAMTLIGAQTVGYRRWLSRSTNAAGVLISTYASPCPKRGSFQPVARDKYQQSGLDYSKAYALWYDPSAGVKTVDRDRGADRINFGGEVWEAVNNNDWSNVDGWQGVLFVKVGNV